MTIEKRGISPVVAEILVILLIVAAIGVIAAFIVPFVRNSLQKSTECVGYEDYYRFDESFGSKTNCYKTDIPNQVYFSVGAKSDAGLEENADGMEIVLVKEDGSSIKASIKEGAEGSNVKVEGKGDNMLEIPKAGEIITYVFSGVSGEKYKMAEVYTRLKSGKICPEKDSINLIGCE
jgi:hypothetical protein